MQLLAVKESVTADFRVVSGNRGWGAGVLGRGDYRARGVVGGWFILLAVNLSKDLLHYALLSSIRSCTPLFVLMRGVRVEGITQGWEFVRDPH